MTVKELKAKLTALDLPTSGNKETLKARLASANKPKPTKKSKGNPVAAAAVASVRQGVEILHSEFGEDELKDCLQFKPFSNNPKSFVLRLPDMKEAACRLPFTPQAKEAIALLRKLRGSVAAAFGDANQTWVLHASGGAAVFSQLHLK
jgi:hypothetical protein